MRTKHSIPQARPMRRRRLALALLAAIAAPAAMAQSLPYGGNVVSGGATIGYSGNTATVNQSTQGAIINWNNFNVGAGYGVTFNQPNASAVILNRVIGNGYGISPTTIDGALTANGHVFIVNSAGITFGSGAQVNVGGLVASTLAISDADFLDGLATGRYRFDGATGASQVRNDADLQAGAGGVALVGPVVVNSGAIVTDGGSIGVGAGTSVTLDFVGDGLTQVTIDLPPTVDSGIVQDRFGSMTADGGRILLRTATTAGGTGGAIYASGLLRAQTMNNVAGRIELTSAGGTVMLGAPGVFSDANSPFTAGTIDVTGNGGQAGGSVLLSGADIILTNEDDNPLDPTDPASFGSVIDASGDGGGGSVELLAGNTLGMLGHTSIRADARATGNGGSVRLDGAVVGIDASTLISTTAKTGAGGSIGVSGSDRIAAFGVLSARGATAGGDITTYSGGDFDIRGLQVDAGGGTPGNWTLWAPNIDVIDGADVGSLATSTSTPGQSVQDAEINTALANGTNVSLRAGTTPTDPGNINFGNGVDIFYDDGTVPLSFRADAQGSITGNNFSIGTNAAALSMAFNADAAGLNTGFAGISFSTATLDSNGGDILLYGQSDLANGMASNDSTGIHLIDSRITTAGGNVLIRGASTGADAGSDDAGVVLDNTVVDAGSGAVAIHGSGAGVTSGIILNGSGIQAGIGGVLIDGQSVEATGLLALASDITSAGGAIALSGTGATAGVRLQGNTVDSGGGDIDVMGTASSVDGIGTELSDAQLVGTTGDVYVFGNAAAGIGVMFSGGSGISTTTGAITLTGEGANFGLDVADGAIDTDSGDLTLIGDALDPGAIAGVRVAGAGLSTNGGNILVTGTSAGGVGVQLGNGGAFAIGSGGGAISINGSGVTAGVLMEGNAVDSGGGVIDVIGSASGVNGTGVDLANAQLVAGAGDVRVFGNAAAGTGVNFAAQSGITTTTGAIGVTGIGATVGLAVTGGTLSTESGHFDLRGLGTAAASDGLVIGTGVNIVTNGGGIELSGEGGSGAGVSLASGSNVDAGNSLVVIRAGNDGSSDAIRLDGAVASTLAVNLRPGGVDANGDLTERTADDILIGGTGAGFALSGAELAMIQSPQLVIGSSLHAGAIRVQGAISRDADLTLQNDGGSGGIELLAAVDVGGGTLALSSGGSITQSAAGAIAAHSLLARAGGDVLLASAQNDVAATTLAGSAGGNFEYQDQNALAIGAVSGVGMDASANGLSSLGASGVSAGGNVFVRNLAGDLTLNADVSGTNIDLVTANTLQNPNGAGLIASGDWRVWANTWVGETRGGLSGDGALPNLYGCQFQGACVVTVPGADSHFIYTQQPLAVITFDDATREYGLPNPLFTFSVAGAILGDSAANVANGSATTSATIGSDVGAYAISGSFTSAAGYQLQFVPGTLRITPATLVFTADPFVRYLGTPNPLFTGTVTGFRNGDTVESVFGSTPVWSSPAGILSPIGYYPVNGGTSAKNYVFVQAPGNATALQVIPLPQLSSTPTDLISDPVNTYLYDHNLAGGAPVCAINASLDDQALASSGDALSNEWSKVRSRPNLTNCFDAERRNGCSDF